MNNNQQSLIEKTAAIISKATKIVAFTGAGISAESGIPPFRGENGIWNKYDPDSLDIDYYYRNTKESWKVIKEIFFDFFNNNEIKPNPGHEVLAKWEKEGKLKCVITQRFLELKNLSSKEQSESLFRLLCLTTRTIPFGGDLGRLPPKRVGVNAFACAPARIDLEVALLPTTPTCSTLFV